MKTVTISKSLEEIWIWKDKCYEESKGLSVQDYLNSIHNNVQTVLKDSGFKENDGRLEKIN
jgi:hypothetical protein